MNYSTLFQKIRKHCECGTVKEIDWVLGLLTDSVDLPTTKAIDLYLGQVTADEGIRRIEFYLFNGTQIQRNYCTLFFARRNEWSVVNKAYSEGLIDWAQAYSR